MNPQNNIRRKTHRAVFVLAFIFSSLCGLQAQVLTPPPGSEALQKLLNETRDKNKSSDNKNVKKKDLTNTLSADYNSAEIEALYCLMNSPQLQDLYLYTFTSVNASAPPTDNYPPELLPCGKNDFNRIMGRYFRVDSLFLDGWRLDLEKIEELLNPSPGSGQAPAKELFLIPVMKPLSTSPSCVNNISTTDLSIVVAGIDSNNNIICTPDGKAKLYEYLKPCPNNCPLNLRRIIY